MVKAVTPKRAPQKVATSSGKKQSSLMSFFGQKKKPVSSPASSQTLREFTEVTDDKENDAAETTIAKAETPVYVKKPLRENNASSPAPADSETSLLASSPSTKRGKKSVSYAESDDDEEEEVINSSMRKRRRVIDDDEDEFVPAKDEKDDIDEFADEGKLDDDDLIEITKPTPVKTPSKLNQFSEGSTYTPLKAVRTPSKTPTKAPKHQKFTKENEERYQWLVEIRDAEKRTPQDPDYDPRTLYIPQSAWSKFTQFETQYWEIKSIMWDCIVFFKKGKFYELYEKDAMIAHNEFDLKIAGGGRANMQLAGIPEMSFDYWATSFIAKGYKVAKVDQKETGLAKEIREGASATKGKNVIQRELKCVLTAGTLTEETMLANDMPMYCCAIKEEQEGENKVFGVAFIDTATGAISMTQFEDDNECTKFETLISQVRPKEVITAKGGLCPQAMRVLKFNCQNQAIFNSLKPGAEFYDRDTTFEVLVRGNYFPAEDLDDLSQWPEVLKAHHENNHTSFSAFGGLLWYLQSLKLDSLISGNITNYTTIKATSLVLDGQTLQNLEIFANSFDGSNRGTLFQLVNRAATPFGKRLLQMWVVHPLLQQHAIESRLDSVDQLLNDGDLRSTIELSLTKLPDLERLVSRVHAGQLKLRDFTRVIEGFEEISALYRTLKDRELAGALGRLIAKFPNKLESCLEKWSEAFDRIKARDDILVLNSGVEADYDESKETIQQLENELAGHLKQYRRDFKTQNIEYKDFGKELYTIEMPVSINVPSSWKQMGASKKMKRWWSPEVESLASDVAKAREVHKMLEDSLKIRMFARFDNDFSVWQSAITVVAQIDCLVSLAKTSGSIGYPAVRPQFTTSDKGYLEFEELRHPFFNTGLTNSKEFIPNNISLGGTHANLGLLTGANAAGKSTVLRMTCVAVILAQLGCYVPCKSAVMTPMDRIMTRLGAQDNIMQGRSTFHVELSETKRILESASPKSLLVLDELGRGGSSSDGFAIAEAVLHHVATHIQSLGFFATHYASLGEGFKHHPQVQPYRMAIIVDGETKGITFQYKLEQGAAEGSFGMAVARMCGIDSEIIDRSAVAAREYEHTSMLKKRVESMMVPLGLQSDFASLVGEGIKDVPVYDETVRHTALQSIMAMVEGI